MEVVCTQKTLAIRLERFPGRICSFTGHDQLSELIAAAIPECVHNGGLDGGIYKQVKAIWITIDCDEMSDVREKEVGKLFLDITSEFCGKRKVAKGNS